MARFTKTAPAATPQVPGTDTSAAALATATPAAATAAVQFGNMSEAEIDAAIRLAVTEQAAAETAKGSATKTAGELVAAASCKLLMLVGRRYQVNVNTKGEDIALMIEGKAVVDKWQQSTKTARFSEYDAIGEAAIKVPGRFSPDLFKTAGGKDKFLTLCRAIVKDATLDAAKLKEIAETKPEQTDGDHIEAMIRLVGKLSGKTYPLIHDVAMFLKELRDEKAVNGLYTSAEQRKLATNAAPTTAAGAPRELTAREKIALYQQQQAAKTVQ